MATLQLDADGARLYRRTTTETAWPGVPKTFPGTITYEKRRMCGWYPAAELRAAETVITDGRREFLNLNFELLRSTGPAEARDAYFNEAGGGWLGPLGYVCADFDVPVVPPPTDGSEPIIKTLEVPGWNAGAVSARGFYKAGRVRFRVKPGGKLLAGLQQGSDPTLPESGFFGINFGGVVPYADLFRLQSTNLTVAVGGELGEVPWGGGGGSMTVESGAVTAGSFVPYSELTTWTVEIRGPNVIMYRDNESPFSVMRVPSTKADVWSLGAAIWAPGAYVDGIEVTQFDGADLRLPRLGLKGGNGPNAVRGYVALPLPTVAGRDLRAGGISLPRVAVRGSNYNLTDAVVVLPLLEVGALDLTPVTTPYGAVRTRGLTVSARGKTGQVARAALETPATRLRGSKGNLADAQLVTPSLRVIGQQEEAGTARFYSHGDARDLLAPFTELAVLMNSGGLVTTAMAIGLLKDAAVDSAASLSDSFTLSAVLAEVMNTEAFIGSDVPLYERPNEVWVVNLANNATSTFESYPFNSFGVIGGRAYGVSQDGLYMLEGDTDQGLPIIASVSYGKQDFGSPTHKHLSRAYVGASSTGKLYLRVTANGQTYTYAARDFSPEAQQQRFDVGRGLQATYFTFELLNEGADFEIDGVSFFAAEFKRRI